MEQAYTRENEAYGLNINLYRCVMETPARLSVKIAAACSPICRGKSWQQNSDQVTAALKYNKKETSLRSIMMVLPERISTAEGLRRFSTK